MRICTYVSIPTYIRIHTYEHSSVTVGVASSVANDVIMRTGAASAVGARHHNENDVIMTIAGLWRYGGWRHVATGCNALVLLMRIVKYRYSLL